MASNAIDMELENTVFLIVPVQFSVVRINIIYPVLKYSTRYFIFCHIHVFSTDFMGFHEILLIAWSCAIFGQFNEIPGLHMIILIT